MTATGVARCRRALETVLRGVYSTGWPRLIYGLQCRNRAFLKITRHVARLRSLAGAGTVRVAFLCDFHFGPTVPTWFLTSAVETTLLTCPDLVLLGGDTLMLDERGAADAVQVLSRLHAPLGVFGVLGNHDIWISRRLSEEAHAAAGVTLLTNVGQVTETPCGPLYVCGCDDAWAGDSDPDRALSGRPPGVPSLMVAHNPVTILEARESKPDLCLCGHTHGGEICRRGSVPIWLHDRRLLPFASGWHRVRQTWMYVSRGLGVAGLPWRLHCPPEVTVLDLTGSE